MKTHWVFNHCKKEKQRARAYWEKKARRLERLLANYSPELRQLRLTLYRHETRHDWELRAVLHLPTGTLVTEEIRPTLEESIDRVADELARRIREHKSLVRKEHLRRRRRYRRQQLSAADPFLVADASALRRDAFVDLLLPHMDQIYDHARRELTILELEGTLPKGAWTARDLVDDVLVRACESFNQRPVETPLDVWLIELLNQRLDELTQDLKPVTLAASDLSASIITDEDEDNADLDDIQYWMQQSLDTQEPLSLEELLPDDDLVDVWDKLSQDERQERLTRILSEFHKHQRQALVLHDAYGFEMSEIARVLNRDEADIEADIQTARDKLRLAFAIEVG